MIMLDFFLFVLYILVDYYSVYSLFEKLLYRLLKSIVFFYICCEIVSNKEYILLFFFFLILVKINI